MFLHLFGMYPPIYAHTCALQTEAQSYVTLHYITRGGDGAALKLANYVRIAGCVFALQTLLQLHIAINI